MTVLSPKVVRDIYMSADGGVSHHIKYDLFGTPSSPPGTGLAGKVRARHQGREYDTETGLTYNRARYYDSASGRFTSSDPMGFAAGDTNLYRYVGNSPQNGIDPSGNVANFVVQAGVGGVIGGIVGGAGYLIFAESPTLGGFGAAVGGGAVAGAVAGLTFGASLAAAGSVGLTGTVGFAAASTVTGVTAGAAGGFTHGALGAATDPNANLSSVFHAGVAQGGRGAFYGGFAGLGFGVALPIAASVTGGGVVGGTISFGAAGAFGDFVAQSAGLSVGLQNRYDLRQTLFAGSTSGIMGGIAGYRDPQLSGFVNSRAALKALDVLANPFQAVNNVAMSMRSAINGNRSGIGAAIAARDARLADIARLNSRERNNVSTVVGGINLRTGQVATGLKIRGQSTGRCAEDICVDALGGNTNEILLTSTVRPRKGETIPVCGRCQVKYPRSMFAVGTPFENSNYIWEGYLRAVPGLGAMTKGNSQ